VFFFALLINVTMPKKFGSAMKILVKIKVYLSKKKIIFFFIFILIQVKFEDC